MGGESNTQDTFLSVRSCSKKSTDIYQKYTPIECPKTTLLSQVICAMNNDLIQAVTYPMCNLEAIS